MSGDRLAQSLAHLLAERERLQQEAGGNEIEAWQIYQAGLALEKALYWLRVLVAQRNRAETTQPAVPRREHGRLGGGPREVRAPRGGADENWKHSQRNHGDGA